MYKKILFPTDGSELARTALPHVKYMAALGHADVLIVEVLDSVTRAVAATEPEVREAAELNVRELENELRYDDIGAVLGAVCEGDPAQTIVEVARSEGADLIVMATRGRSGVPRMILGSVADHVARHAECPVLLVKPEALGQ